MTDPIETTAVAVREQSTLSVTTPMSVQEIIGQVSLIQEVMRKVMTEGEHYGKVPGCGDKKVLLKSGAEKLCMTFRLAPTYDVKRSDMANGHREYEVVCTLNGRFQGVGSCSTMEGKYRFRTGPKKSTDQPVPKGYWDLRGSNPAQAQAMLGGKGFSTMKDEAGSWVICELGEKVEHDNPADHYNTVLKMAKKRAFVDAVLSATSASDIFTQDLAEELEEPNNKPESAQVESNPKAAPVPTQPAKTPPKASQSAKQAILTPEQEKADHAELLRVAHKLIPESRREDVAQYLCNFVAPDGKHRAWLLAGETLEDLSLEKLKTLVNKWDSFFRDAIDKFILGHDMPHGAEAAPSTPEDSEFEIDPGPEPAWKSHVFHFGPAKGVTLGEFARVDSKKLWGWCKNYDPTKDKDGSSKKPSPMDLALRKALDECLAHMEAPYEHNIGNIKEYCETTPH